MNKKLHILFLCGWFPSKVMSTNGDFIQRHAEAVATLHKVSVLHIISSSEVTKNTIEISEKNGVKIYIGYLKKTKNPILKLIHFWKIFKQIITKINTIDIVHLNEIYPFGIFALYLKKKSNIPFIISEHWTGYLNNSIKDFDYITTKVSKKIAKNASFICPVSNNLATAMQKLGLKGNYNIIPNVVDTNIFKPIKSTSQKFTIIHISSLLDQHKNISGMLKVAKALELEIKDFHWKFVGGAKGNFTQLINELSFNKATIEFVNHVPQKKLVTHLQTADVFVLFSNYENLPCVVLESFSCGVPVISTKVGGIHEFFPNNFGKLIEQKNEKQLLQSLLQYYRNPTVNKDKMYAYAKENFSRSKIADSFSKLYFKSLN